MYHNFFIHSSVGGHLGCSYVLAIVISAALNTGVHVFFVFQCGFLQGICLHVVFWDHMVVLFLVFKGISIVLSIVAESVYFPTNNATGFPLLHIISKFFDDNHADSLWSHGLYSLWNSPGQNTTVGSHSLLQGIFPTQGSKPGLPHCRRIPYQLSHQGSLSFVGRVCKTILWDYL